MKKLIYFSAILFSIFFVSCKGKESATSVASQWCELNGKLNKATTDEAKATARANKEKFEKDMEAKYKSDTAFMIQVGLEVNKCEAASEGR